MKVNRQELYEQLQKIDLRVEEMRRSLPEASRYGFAHVRRLEQKIASLEAEAIRLHGIVYGPPLDRWGRPEGSNLCTECGVYRFENDEAAFKAVGRCPRCCGEILSPFDPNWSPHDLTS